MAGFAQTDIEVKPYNMNKTYGTADADVDPASLAYKLTGALADPSDAAKFRTLLKISRSGANANENVGSYSYTFKNPTSAEITAAGFAGDYNILIDGSATLTIDPKNVGDVAPATVADQEFHVGSWNTPAFTWAGMTLDEDYEITGYTESDGTTAITGMGDNNQVHVRGIGNYTGTTFFTFNIDRMTIGDGTDAKNGMSAEFNAAVNLTYDGTVKDVPAFTIKENGVAVADVENNFVIMTPGDMTNAGNKYITIAGKGTSPYNGSFKLPFTIAAKDITDESIKFGAVANETYTGDAFTPTPTVKDAEILTAGEPTLLESGTHFDYEYEANTNAGNAAKVKVVGKGNYTGTKEITFRIAKRDIAAINVTAIAPLTYTGVAQTPAVVIAATTGITTLPAIYDDSDPENPTGDYTVRYENNKDASVNGKAIIEAVENSNYTGSKTIPFTINKATITVTPKDFTRALNEDDPTSDYLVANEYYTLNGFQNGETAISANFSGAPSFTILDHADVVGVYADKIKVNVDEFNVVTGLTAANYKFAAGANATLTITGANNFSIAFKNDITVEYGDATNLAKIYGDDNVNAKNYLVVTGLGEDVIKSMTITVVDENGDVVDPATVKNAGIYYLKATPASIQLVTTAHEANYDFAGCTIANGSFQITQRPIAFQAVNQTIAYGEDPSLTTGNDHIALVSGSYAYEDGRSDMNFELTIDPKKYNGSVKTHTGALKLSATNPNYKFTLTDGDIIVTAGGATLDLSGLASDEILPRIKDYNNVACNVVISFDNRSRAYSATGTKYGWAAEKWNTLTLPFDITVADLSKALGYAIVNVINPDRTEIDGENSKVYGKLTMTGGNADGPSDVLVANKPFMVKTAKAITGNVTFENVTIKAPASEADRTVDAGKGVNFIGTYAKKTVSATDDGKIWFMEGDEAEWATIFAGSTSTWTLVPFEGYVDLNNASGARNLTFIMEELDGSTTAITSVNADADNMKAEGVYNLNGVKMEGALKKGVYIKDGKKFVVK